MDKRQTREAKSTAGHIIFISNLGKEHNINLKVSLPELYYCRKILLPVLNIFNHIYSKRTERLCVNRFKLGTETNRDRPCLRSSTTKAVHLYNKRT